MKPNDWQDTVEMAASAIEDLLGTADEHAGCWADVPARLRALTAPPAPAVPEEAKLGEMPFLGKSERGYVRGRNDCRAAMLNHVGDANEKAAEKCECSSIDYCENCLRAMLAQPVSGGYKLVPVDFLTTASRLIDLCRTYCILSDGGNYKERTLSECESTMEVIDGLLAAAPEGGNG